MRFLSGVLEWDKGPAFDARINSGEHGHTVDVHDIKVESKWAYFSV